MNLTMRALTDDNFTTLKFTVCRMQMAVFGLFIYDGDGCPTYQGLRLILAECESKPDTAKVTRDVDFF